MAPKQPCTKYQYVVTASGPKILPVDEPAPKDEESPADYNMGGYLPIKVNDTFSGNRYRVVRKLGWGHFSTVWLVRDAFTHRHSALKVVKSAGRYAETARDEIKLLSRVSSISPLHPGRDHIVSFLDSFSHQAPESSHVCIVFEPLGENLLALIERHKKKGVPRVLVRVIARQMLLGLEYLHDECDLVHTDIKPENILISIPDIETHIQNELTQSPSPISRRVGVPLPVKTRPGVAIPQTQQRSRRQVQIFHSQPLSSPRSAGRVQNRLDSSGSTSVSSSYIAQMQMSRIGSVYNGSPGTSITKVASGLASSLEEKFPFGQQKIVQAFAAKGIIGVPTKGADSPSTSSSSSSISSTMASTTAGSSSLNTPPTSHSISNLREFIGIAPLESELRTGPRISPVDLRGSDEERKGLPIPPKKVQAKTDLESELCSAMSTSWKGIASSPRSHKSVGSPGKAGKNGHLHARSRSGLSNSNFWKDPGTGALAPAVLVSAVVGADGFEDVFTKVSLVDAPTVVPSETSSATTTVGRPSPVGTPLPISTKKSTSLAIGPLPSNNELPLPSNAEPPYHNNVTPANGLNPNDQHTASLLSQTAPRPASSSKRAIIRNSPPQQISQLSAHMHHNKPPDASHNNASHIRSGTKSRASRIVESSMTDPAAQSAVVSPVVPSIPFAPPPTPIDASSITSMTSPPLSETHSTDNSEQPSETPNLPLLQTCLDDQSMQPPISIKIADLGNATPSKKHFTEDIQTRQYRAPEAILGRRDWDARVDIWSLACVIFELLTAEYLFDPQGQGELFTKDDDHMAQIIELLGDFPLEVKMGGKYSRELFDHTGGLRYIKTLKPWPLKRVMIEKYLYPVADSSALCDFLKPMLNVAFRERVIARDMRDHKWLEATPEDGVITEW